jgi:hypothetical protein
VEAGIGKRKRDDMADLEAQLLEVLLYLLAMMSCTTVEHMQGPL